MTRDELIEKLSASFYDHFADTVAAEVVACENEMLLYELLRHDSDLSAWLKERIGFRAAYVLERIYFNYPDSFRLLQEPFCEDFAYCSHPGARRHYTKIMAHLLRTYRPVLSLQEQIAEAAAAWAIDPRAKAAVRIGAIEVLLQLKNSVEWVAASWNDLLESVTAKASPAIASRFRNKWKHTRS